MKSALQLCYDGLFIKKFTTADGVPVNNPWYGFLTPWGAKTFPRDHWPSGYLLTVCLYS